MGVERIGVFVLALCTASAVIYIAVTDRLAVTIPFYKGEIKGTLLRQDREEILCENLLLNITDGKWSKRIEFLADTSEEYQDLVKKEDEYDLYLSNFRIKRGIHTRLWRDDLKCGNKNFQGKPKRHRWGERVGGWCEAKSDKPCCSDHEDGVCGTGCNCTRCVDLRKIYHAELSKWIPRDPRCTLQNYTADTACEIIRRFSEIHFVGDSFVRKMGRAFILTLRSDPTFGGLIQSYSEEKRNLCIGIDQFYWTECALPGWSPNLRFLRDKRPFCGISLEHFSIQVPMNVPAYHKIVNNLVGKVGAVVIVGIGAHQKCNSTFIYGRYLLPSVKYRESYYETKNMTESETKWPHIIFMYPDKPGLLKASAYDSMNGKTLCETFSNEMKYYCKMHGIPVLDFRKLTTGVHSYDGAHHGLGVNLMKTQLLLNYLDSMSKRNNMFAFSEDKPVYSLLDKLA